VAFRSPWLCYNMETFFIKKIREVKKLKSDIEKKLEIELASTLATLKSTEATLAQTRTQLAAQIQLVSNLNKQINDLKDDIDCLKSKADADEGSC